MFTNILLSLMKGTRKTKYESNSSRILELERLYSNIYLR